LRGQQYFCGCVAALPKDEQQSLIASLDRLNDFIVIHFYDKNRWALPSTDAVEKNLNAYALHLLTHPRVFIHATVPVTFFGDGYDNPLHSARMGF
jgi:hypothetical protein